MEAGMRDLPAGLVLLISETAKFDVKFVVGDVSMPFTVMERDDLFRRRRKRSEQTR